MPGARLKIPAGHSLSRGGHVAVSSASVAEGPSYSAAATPAEPRVAEYGYLSTPPMLLVLP